MRDNRSYKSVLLHMLSVTLIVSNFLESLS